MASSTTSIRLPDELMQGLDVLARATERNRNYLITQAVHEFVARETWHLQRIREGLRQIDAGEIVPDAELDAFWTSWITPAALAEARKDAAAELAEQAMQ